MHPCVHRTTRVFAALAAAFTAQAACAAPRYHLVDIPTDDRYAFTTAINELEDVAFESGFWGGGFSDYVYRKGAVEKVSEQDEDMSGFNDRGDFVGVSYDQNFHAYLSYLPRGTWGRVIEPSFDYTGVGRGSIADNRVVVASASVAGVRPKHFGQRCFRWRDGVTLAELKTEGDVCTVSAVSHRAVATGTVNKHPGDPYQAYVWAPGHFQMLGTLGGSTSTGTVVNDLGHVALWSELAPDAGGQVNVHAALFDGTALIDIGTLPGDVSSYTTGMNDLDEIVGSSYSPAGEGRPFLYTGGQMLALGDLIEDLPAGTASYTVNGINHGGQIAGTRIDADGVQHPFVLERVSN